MESQTETKMPVANQPEQNLTVLSEDVAGDSQKERSSRLPFWKLGLMVLCVIGGLASGLMWYANGIVHAPETVMPTEQSEMSDEFMENTATSEADTAADLSAQVAVQLSEAAELQGVILQQLPSPTVPTNPTDAPTLVVPTVSERQSTTSAEPRDAIKQIAIADVNLKNFMLYNAGEAVAPGELANQMSYNVFFFDLVAADDGVFSEPIALSYTWKYGSYEHELPRTVVVETGPQVIFSASHMIDEPTPEALRQTTAELVVTAEGFVSKTPLPELTQRYEYRLTPDTNQPGLHSVAFSVASERSQPEVYDREVIIGASVVLYDADFNVVDQMQNAHGVSVFRDIPDGTYWLEAQYKGAASAYGKVTFGEGMEDHQYVFLIVPIKPSHVDSYTGTIRGQLVSPHGDFYTSHTHRNQLISLRDVAANKIVQTTKTDQWGVYVFENVPGDVYYAIDYTAPAPWSTHERQDVFMGTTEALFIPIFVGF